MPKYRFLDEKKAHLHQINVGGEWKPLLGTSTITGVINKPLTWWASGMAVSLLGWKNPKNTPLEARISHAGEVLEQIKGLDTESYETLLQRAYRAHNEKKESSAEEGTDMHALLEAYVKECIETNEGKPIVLNGQEHERVTTFMNWACEKVDHFEFSEANVYSEKMWTGGVTDLVLVMKDGKRLIGDFKSSKEAYLSQFIQIAGYDLQQEENGFFTSEGENISPPLKVDGYVVFPFGAEVFEPAFRYNTEELKEGFRSALVLYKLMNN